jgi:putative component of toxin-antitoxin plasmid stabilization module
MWPHGHILATTELRKADRFARWLDGLRDLRVRARSQARLDRLAENNPGDVPPLPNPGPG